MIHDKLQGFYNVRMYASDVLYDIQTAYFCDGQNETLIRFKHAERSVILTRYTIGDFLGGRLTTAVMLRSGDRCEFAPGAMTVRSIT